MASHPKDLVPLEVAETLATEPEDEGAAKSPFTLPDLVVAKVLGFLPLQDRFRLETVCRQWQWCMFVRVERLCLHFSCRADRQYSLEVKDLGIVTSPRTQELSAVLRKLRESTVDYLECKIVDDCSDCELLVLLADIASRAAKAEFCYKVSNTLANFLPFGDVVGPHVTTFNLYLYMWQRIPEDIEAFVDALARMKRLRALSSNWPEFLFTCLNSLPDGALPLFQELKLWYSDDCDCELWQHFKALYGSKVKTLTFYECYFPDDEGPITEPLKGVAFFGNLECLKLVYRLDHLAAFTRELEAVTGSCVRLTTFYLGTAGRHTRIVSVTEVRKLFAVVGRMKRLEKLGLRLYFHCESLGDDPTEGNLDLLALLENRSRITHFNAYVNLSLVSAPDVPIRREIYGALNDAMPNVKHLVITCLASEMDHLVGLRRMQILSLDFLAEEAPELVHEGLIRILRSSPALVFVKVRCHLAEVSVALIEAIFEVAKLQMEKHIDFMVSIRVHDKSQQAWEARKHLAPRNLTFILDDEKRTDS